jgi:hypothetical protein
LVDADDADVIRRSADRAGNVSPVPVEVEGSSVVLDEVPSIGVVDEAVHVVVASAGRIVVHPDISAQIRVIQGHARVDHRHKNRLSPSLVAPRVSGLDLLEAP